jgi:ribosome-associated heat shock protein Hsp15
MPPTDPRASPPEHASLSEQRLDKWLWYARIAKSRTLATKLIEAGHFRVNRVKAAKGSVTVRCGDVLTAFLQNRVRIIEIVALGERRGPPAEAQSLYRERALTGVEAEPPG